MSRAPPLPKAITGVPQAWASTVAMPKSSSAAKTAARASWVRRTSSGVSTRPRISMLGAPAAAARTGSMFGPSPTTTSRRPGMRRKASATSSTRL
jgi:hypothetical protein